MRRASAAAALAIACTLLAACGPASRQDAASSGVSPASPAQSLASQRPTQSPPTAAVPERTASSGACGFPDCVTPRRRGACASCDATLFRSIVAQSIDGSIDIGGSGRDGNYLVLNIAHRTCASTGPAPWVKSLGLAFFVAQDGMWNRITYGRTLTCDLVPSTMEQPHSRTACALVRSKADRSRSDMYRRRPCAGQSSPMSLEAQPSTAEKRRCG